MQAQQGNRETADDLRKVLHLNRSPRRSAIRWLAAAGLAAILALATVLVLRQRAESRAPEYITETVRRADVHVTVSATGKIQGLNTVEVGGEVTGRVLRVLVDYNDRVRKGQILAEIDPEQLRAALDEANAQVLSAEANIGTAKATLLESKQARERSEEQASQGLISQKDLEAARAAWSRAQASLSSATANASLARAALKSAQSRLAKTKILAPIDGIVLGRNVEPGQTVTAGFQTPVLFRVAEDLTKLSLHVDVDEADVGHVREGAGATFTVDAYPERIFPSAVVSLRNEPKNSQNVVSYEAVLSVDNSERLLRPGMTATATITSEVIKDTLVVPNAALRFVPPAISGEPPPAPPKGKEKRVYVLRDGMPKQTSIATGATDGSATQVVGGELPIGTKVVVDVILPR